MADELDRLKAAREYRERCAAGELSIPTLWDILRENGALPDGFDSDVEASRLEQSAAMLEFGRDVA